MSDYYGKYYDLSLTGFQSSAKRIVNGHTLRCITRSSFKYTNALPMPFKTRLSSASDKTDGFREERRSDRFPSEQNSSTW